MREQNTWQTILAIPRAFLHGLFGGLFGPPLALGLAVGLIYLATGQLPAFKDVRGADDVRRGAITLAQPLEARASWARYVGEVRGAMLELKARRQAR
ncbi:MAG: hypothetical protein ACK2VD_12625 [Anaerolineae bacterium]|jgi:hypothetical protein